MVVTVLYTDYEHCTYPALLNTYDELLPAKLLTRAQKFKRWQDRQAYILGKLLIWKGLQMHHFQGNSLMGMEESRYGKPYVPSGIPFNISHSGRYVVAAFCTTAIGIDIEEINPVNNVDFGYIFSEKEKLWLKNSKDPGKDFFRIWAMKESLIKADGRGLSLTLPSINVVDQETVQVENDHWFVKEIDHFQNYCCAITTKERVTELVMKKIDF